MPKAPKQTGLSPTTVLILLSALIWCFLFRYFLNASAALQGDAYPYLGHIRFYLDSIVAGIYPLWNPWEDNGNANEFFLRRIGEFNPFFLLIKLLEQLGLGFTTAHRLFLGGYFFLGVAGFYLLSFRTFRDRTAAMTAALLLLFSSWGGKVFESFIILEFVPFIWFAFFLTAFVQSPRQVFLLGAVFCLMIINVTYIPFYFYTIFGAFIVFWAIVYNVQCATSLSPARHFILNNKKFAALCCMLVFLSLIPGALWYKATQSNEAYAAGRGSQVSAAHTNSVSIAKVNEGGILPHLIFDRQFINTNKLRLDDPYLPVFAFLMFVSGIWFRLSRRLVLFFLFGGMMFMIGLANATFVHGLLYTIIPFFKLFRNVQFFLWLAILPAMILFAVDQAMTLTKIRSRHPWLITWIIATHAAALALCAIAQVSGIATYATIILSLVWMLFVIHDQGRNPRLALCLLWAAIVVQPFGVLGQWAERYPPIAASRFAYENPHTLILPSAKKADDTMRLAQIRSRGRTGSELLHSHFAVRWYYEALENIPRPILATYLSVPFLTYDGVESVRSDSKDHAKVAESMAVLQNIAFAHTDRPLKFNSRGSFNARIITDQDRDFEILRFTPVSLTVRTSFERDQFLVWTSNYHSLWRAYIDGRETPVIRTNILSQGLSVPSGDHVIRWQFHQTWRYVLGYCFIMLYLGTLGVILWLACRSRKSA